MNNYLPFGYYRRPNILEQLVDAYFGAVIGVHIEELKAKQMRVNSERERHAAWQAARAQRKGE